MNRKNQFLAGLLLVQIVIAFVSWNASQRQGPEQKKLLPVKADEVTALTVSSQTLIPENPIEMLKITRDENGNWVVPDAEGFPLDTPKVNDMLGRLTAATIGIPVAKKKENHNALKVGERDYGKMVIVEAGEKKWSLLAGNAKGSAMHARYADQDEVYLAKGIKSWDISHQIASYADTRYIHMDDPVEIRVRNPNGEIALQRSDDGEWMVAQLPPGTKIDAARVKAFVNAARSIRMDRPVGRTIKPYYLVGDNARVRVELRDAERILTYNIGGLQGEFVYLKADDNEFVVKTRKYTLENLINQTADAFISTGGIKEIAPGRDIRSLFGGENMKTPMQPGFGQPMPGR